MLREHVLKFFLVTFLFFAFPWSVSADSLSQQVVFSVNSDFDLHKRSEVSASVRKITDQLYFYIEDAWWNSVSVQRRSEMSAVFSRLALHFEEEIYPTLTAIFGKEATPGIDNDMRITVLVHQMKDKARGYVNTADGYTKFQVPRSNEREMLYLNLNGIETSLAKSYFAHEFMHLIHFNEKELKKNIVDDIWFQEGLAELAPTFVGYDNDMEQGYLDSRKRDFIKNPRDSITEWKGLAADYGVVHIFFQYLLEQYGQEVLADAFKSAEIGIVSLNEAFTKHGIAKDFAQVFEEWTIAVFLNDCTYGSEYCFTNPKLADLKIAPFTNFLSPFGNSELTVSNQTKNWTGNWHKISGGKDILKVLFDGNPTVTFRVPYLIEKRDGTYEIGSMTLSEEQNGEVVVQGFKDENKALIIIPSIQTKVSDFLGSEQSYFFSWTASTEEAEEEEPQAVVVNPDPIVVALLAQIAELQAEVLRLQAAIVAALGGDNSQFVCGKFNVNLYFGLQDNADVSCLQQFLRDQGSEIYPEGLVTGNFLSLTRQAVTRFQEKYAEDVLTPLGLTQGTGYVGSLTRNKINAVQGTDLLVRAHGLTPLED